MKFVLSLLISFIFSSGISQAQQPTINIEVPPLNVQVFAPEIVSRQFNERDFAISPEGDEILFTLGNHNHTLRALVHSTKKNGLWSPFKLLPFSGTHNDIEPFFHPNGDQLFFASNRPLDDSVDRKDYNIWVVDKIGSTWSAPSALPSVINSDSDEFYPAVAANGNIYFTATYENGIGTEDIFRSQYLDGEYAKPMPIDTAINSLTYEFNAYISPDESVIVFSSYGRSDDLGGSDLYVSQKDDQGRWIKARHLENGINSDQLDYCPFIDFQRKAFYFTSQRKEIENHPFESINNFESHLLNPGNGLDDIYWIHLEALELK